MTGSLRRSEFFGKDFQSCADGATEGGGDRDDGSGGGGGGGSGAGKKEATKPRAEGVKPRPQRAKPEAGRADPGASSLPPTPCNKYSGPRLQVTLWTVLTRAGVVAASSETPAHSIGF